MERWVDYYGVLQVHPDAEEEVVQSAYKRLCRKYHPDVNPSRNAADIIVALNSAYAVLGDAHQRRAYHREWLRRNGCLPFPGKGARQAMDPTHDTAAPETGSALARKAVHAYFTALSNGDFGAAYENICEADKQAVSREAFVEWQQSVSSLYEIGRFSLSLFKKHADFKIHECGGFCAEEYKVAMCEKNKKTGQVAEYAFAKYAVLERGLWKVYLGYRDLEPILVQLRHLAAEQQEESAAPGAQADATTDLTVGLPNRKGFEAFLTPEAYRNRRYARPAAVAVFQLFLPDRITDEENVNRLIKFAGYLLKQNVRASDQVGYLDYGQFGVIFTETPRQQAELATRRLLRSLRHHISSCFDFTIKMSAGLTDYSGQPLDNAVRACLQSGRVNSVYNTRATGEAN